MKSIIIFFLSGLLLTSCNKEKLCADAEQRIPGKILRITGPDTLQLGMTVPLIVAIAANDSFCIRKANGLILDTGRNYVQIGAELIYTGERKHNNCGCTDGQTVYTVIYFTPNVPGRYVFGTRKPSGLTNAWPVDDTTYHAIVK